MPLLLIVDDDARNRGVLADLAASLEFDVLTAGDLREARDQIARHRPQVVLSVPQLADGSALVLSDELLAATTSLIVVADDARIEFVIEALRHGVSDYLRKPVSGPDLRAALSRALRRHTPTSETGPAACITIPVGISLAEADRRLILATLQQCGGVKKWAAGLLGVSLKTLYNRLEEYRRSAAAAATPAANGADSVRTPTAHT